MRRWRRLSLLLAPVVFLAAAWLSATSGITAASALVSGTPVTQCNDVANVGATVTTCAVTITNNITYNADGSSSTASTIVTSVNGLATTTTSTSPITQIHQCNQAASGGASTLTCTATITNNITGAPASGAATSTVDQCDPLLGAPTRTCTTTPAGPNATGGHQAIGQCNRSGATGTVTCTATTGTATDAAPAVTIDQCNNSGTTGASTVTCTSTITNTFTCVGATTTLANGACSAATSSTTGSSTSTTVGGTSTTGSSTSTTVGRTSTTRSSTSTTVGGTGTTRSSTSTTVGGTGTRPGGGANGTRGGTTGAGTGTTGSSMTVPGSAAAGNVRMGTATAVASSANPSLPGQLITLTATVAGPGSTAGGTVSFYDEAALMGSAPLVAGRGTFKTSALAIGDHPITARVTAATRSSTATVLRQTVRSAGSSSSTGVQTSSLAQTGGGAALPTFAVALLFIMTGFLMRSAARSRTSP